MDDSHIHVSAGATTFVGPDATRLYQAAMLKTAIRTYQRSRLILTRGATIGRLMQMAGGITGKTYRRGQYDTAIADLEVWCNAMKSALPITRDDDQNL